jgi:hypothetical protein
VDLSSDITDDDDDMSYEIALSVVLNSHERVH